MWIRWIRIRIRNTDGIYLIYPGKVYASSYGTVPVITGKIWQLCSGNLSQRRDTFFFTFIYFNDTYMQLCMVIGHWSYRRHQP
jgi:hypothetical protein